MNFLKSVAAARFVGVLVLIIGIRNESSAADSAQYPLSIAVSESTIMLADRNLPGVWKLEGGQL
ncbi:MAG TPA: hypothetical protein P5307_05135, partial [Pirellulaceae bacterium]|nr:hypothetical protein [Pirellulaceae bacterium]